MELMHRANVLNYRNSRYLKLFVALVIVAILSYVLNHPSATEPYGGTVLGYVLGFLSLAIVLLLFWYGVRKRCTSRLDDRRNTDKGDHLKKAEAGEQNGIFTVEGEADGDGRRSPDRRKGQASQSWRYGQTLQGWLSAHIYLGASLIVLATLHTGFEFGWNVHMLAYVLMMVVIFSGFYGLFLYLNYPRLITENLGEGTLEGLLEQIAELNEAARIRALDLPDDLNRLVLKARLETRIGGNFWQQIGGIQTDCPTTHAAKQVYLYEQKYTKDEQPKFLRDLYSVILRKQKLVQRAREAVKLKARMDAWLYLHVPVSVALLAALFAHVFSILFFW